MATVALIGPDGAGKTTLTRMLAASGALPFRYLYMGVDISASNIALPSSRLAEWLKQRLQRQRATPAAGARRPASAARRSLRAARAGLRLVNRLGEECYRQLVSWTYELRGFVVLYDRHFIFDFAPEIQAALPDSLERRIHRRFLRYVYPRPDLVILLDAPGDVLFARKGESTVMELERRRQAFLRQGEKLPNFVRVDATRPLDEVYREILSHTLRLHSAGRTRAAGAVR
jgi:thymidylate kinase